MGYANTAGGSAQRAVVGIGVDANNRQLHQSEYDLARRYKKIIADKLGISQDEAEGRIIRQIQRNVDADTAAKDSYRRDEPIISLIVCQLLKCDASVTDPNYKNSAVNSEYIAPNQAAFDRGQQQTRQGLTPAQITDRNNAAGAPIAQAGALVLGGYVLAPAVAAIGAEAIAFTKNPVAYCAINPVSCVTVVDTVAGTAAGVPVTGVTVPHAVPSARVNTAKEVASLNNVPKSPVDVPHAIGAEYTKAGKPTGGHSLLNGDVRIVSGTESLPDASGVYKATIQVPDPQNPGQWITKTSNNSMNSMFPKHWDAATIQSEVDAAWNSQNKVINGNKWSSFTPSGVKVEGFISPRTTVYPVHQP